MTLINALLPLIRPLQVTSLHPLSTTSLKSSTSKRFIVWSNLSIVLLILFFIHGIFDFNFYSQSQASIVKTIIYIKLCSVRLSHITILVESFLQRESLIEIIDILSLIDRTLIKKLGINVDHKGFKKLLQNYLIIGFAIFLSIEISVLVIFLNDSSIQFLAFWIASLFSFTVIFLRYLQIITFIYIIKSRLSIINLNLYKIGVETSVERRQNIVSIIGHLEDDNQGMLKIQNKKFRNFDEISILRELFGKLWDVSKLINTCFGTSLLVCVGNDFGIVTLNGYWMYLSYKNSINLAVIWSIGLWSIPNMLSLVFLAGICYSTMCKVSVEGKKNNISFSFSK